MALRATVLNDTLKVNEDTNAPEQKMGTSLRHSNHNASHLHILPHTASRHKTATLLHNRRRPHSRTPTNMEPRILAHTIHRIRKRLLDQPQHRHKPNNDHHLGSHRRRHMALLRQHPKHILDNSSARTNEKHGLRTIPRKPMDAHKHHKPTRHSRHHTIHNSPNLPTPKQTLDKKPTQSQRQAFKEVIITVSKRKLITSQTETSSTMPPLTKPCLNLTQDRAQTEPRAPIKNPNRPQKTTLKPR